MQGCLSGWLVNLERVTIEPCADHELVQTSQTSYLNNQIVLGNSNKAITDIEANY